MLLRARVSLLDRPGALLAVAKALADAGGNIVDIEILASGDGRAIDELVVDLPGDDQAALTAVLGSTGAEVLDVRRVLRLSGQRPDLDLLARVAGEPTAALATVVQLAAPIWSADWAAAVAAADPATPVRSSLGTPTPLPDGLPVPMGPLPRRTLVDATAGHRWEVVVISWREHYVYLARQDGPTFLQVELLQIRRVLELAAALAAPPAP